MMVERTILRGNFLIANDALIRDKANRDDPRNVFYKAMLDHRTYEAYEDAVRGIAVSVPTFRTGMITGRMEILYAEGITGSRIHGPPLESGEPCPADRAERRL
jgi:hypothetical protein